MPATGPISIHDLLGYPFVAGRISRLAPLSPVMSKMFGVNLSTSGSGKSARVNTGATRRSPKRDIVLDVMDNSRTGLGFRAPGTGPERMRRKSIGTQTIRGLRTFAAWPFRYEDLRDFRPIGESNPSIVDPMAANYISRQVDIAIQRAMNNREYVFVQMLKGSLGVVERNDSWWFAGPGVTPTWTVSYGLPDRHKEQLACGGAYGDDDIITASWGTASTDIISQLAELRHVAMRRSGIEPRVMWMNSKLFATLRKNTVLQAQGGTAFKVFDTFTRSEVTAPSAADEANRNPSPYYFYKLRGLPEMDVYVYDGGMHVGGPNVEDGPEEVGNWVPFLRDNEVIITPEISNRTWFENFDIMEVVQEQYETQPVEKYGFHAWLRREMKDVPSVEFMLLDNFAFGLTIPNAIYNPTVVF